MKNTAYALEAFIIIYAMLLLQGNTNAAFWEDPFEQEAAHDWQHVGDDSIWRVEDGFLRAEIQAQNRWSTIFERYQFIAYPGLITILQSRLKPWVQRALDSASLSQSISEIP